jgi:hypothetical protein
MMEGGIQKSTVSKPFVVAAVSLVFAGSSIGAVWTMSLFGSSLPVDARAFSLHSVLQVDGFLSLLIMGIGYMIVPRFRNASLPSTRLAYVSFALVAASTALYMVSSLSANSVVGAAGSAAKISGVGIFAGMVFWMIRIRPKLLGMADYFIGISITLLAALSIMQASGIAAISGLAKVQAWLLFPVLMIFGVKYKTMPSFLGFIRPRKRPAQASVAFAGLSAALAIASIFSENAAVHMAFNLALVACTGLLAASLFIFGGFDNSEILRLISGEKKARYTYTLTYTRISFLFLFAGAALAMLFSFAGDWAFLFYDLVIHYTAIGFVGTTIALYLPLMLPPITGRAVHFARFSHAPVLLIVAALGIRAVGDAAIVLRSTDAPASYAFMASGWLVVAALAAFVAMVHRSTQDAARKKPISEMQE